MEDVQSNNNKNDSLYIKEEETNNEIFYDIFSHIGQFEKNKRYQQLQKDLFTLNQDVKLMEDFINNGGKLKKKKNNAIIKKININDKEKDTYKRYFSRGNNGMNFRRRISSLYQGNMNNLTSGELQFEGRNNNSKENIYKSVNINRRNLNNNDLYKTDLKNYNDVISEDDNEDKFPNIFHSVNKTNHSKIIKKNLDSNNFSKLPKIQTRNKQINQNKKYFITEGNYDNTINISINGNSNNNRIIQYKKIPQLRTENIKDNSIIKNYPNILNSQRTNRSINPENLSMHTDSIVKKMKDKNMKIKNRINHKLIEQNMIDWEMKSKFKLAKWKYGIAEVQKYFIDLNAFGKPEEDELINRKTFYDLVEDLIDDIKKTKEEREIKSIEDKYIDSKNNDKKYGNSIKKNDKAKSNKLINDDINAVDNTLNKKKYLSNVLKKVKLRQMKEKKQRDLIHNIFFKSDLRTKAIDDSVMKLIKSKKILNMSHESNKSNRIEKTKKEIEANEYKSNDDDLEEPSYIDE